MESLFCKNCGNTGPSGYSLGKISSCIGFMFVFFAFIALCSENRLAAIGTFVFFGGIAAVCFVAAYATRALHCGLCGSADLLPPFSPKAQEFQLRNQVFGHASRHISEMTPQPEIQYQPERNITPPDSRPLADDRLSAFRDSIRREEPHS